MTKAFLVGPNPPLSTAVNKFSVVYLALNDMNRHDAQRAHVWDFCEALVAQPQIRRVTLITPTKGLIGDLGERLEHKSVHAPRSPLGLLLREWRILRYLWRTLRRDRIDLIYMRDARLSFGGPLFAASSSTPLVLEVNGATSEEYRLTTTAPGAISFFVSRLIEAVFRFNCSRSQKIIAVTQGLGNYVVKRCGVPPEKVRVFPNGVNTSTFVPMEIHCCRTRVGLNNRRDYIGFVGSLTPWEGVESLIKAFARVRSRLPTYHLIIVGDGPEREKLIDLSRQLGLDERIAFTGRVKHELVPWFVNSCSVLVVPLVHVRQSVAEVSPLKTYEYLACGKPVVASRLPGLEFIEQEGLGFLFRPRDDTDMAQALVRAANLTTAEAAAMGRKARRIADDRHSWTKLVQRIMQFVLDDDRCGTSPMVPESANGAR